MNDMLTNITVANILQYIHVSLHCKLETFTIFNYIFNTAGGREMPKYQLMDSCQNMSHQTQQREQETVFYQIIWILSPTMWLASGKMD